MAHEKVHVICENLCLEEGMTKKQIEDKFDEIEAYSVQEKRIGTWSDGKPLYRKVLETSVLNINTDLSFVDASLQNVDTVTKLEGLLYTGDNRTIPMNLYAGANSYTNLYLIDKTTFRYRSSWTGNVVIIVEYTKTTDQANV